jgi:hypothetical protein
MPPAPPEPADLPESQSADEWNLRWSQAAESLQRLLGQAAEARALGHAVERAFGEFDSLFLEREQEGGGVHLLAISAATGRRQSISGVDLPECLRAALGDEQPRKRCLSCGLVKPLTKFSRYKKSKDNKNASCLECERLRVQRATQKKKAEQQ